MSYVISNNRTCDKCSQFKNAKHQTIFRWCNIFRFCLETKKKLSSSSQNIRSDKTGGGGEGKEEKIIFFFLNLVPLSDKTVPEVRRKWPNQNVRFQ